MHRLIKLLKRPTGQLIAIALFLVLVSYIARAVYIDQPKADEAALAKTGEERVGILASKLLENAASAESQDTFIASLPAHTDWYPNALPCAGQSKVGANPFWQSLGFEVGETTAFQYRFDRTAGSFEFRARRDQDCDGIFVVHHVSGTIIWPKGISGAVQSLNIGE